MALVNLSFYITMLRAIRCEYRLAHYEFHLTKLKELEEALLISRLKLEQSLEEPHLSKSELHLLENSLLNLIQATAFQRKRILSSLLQDIQDSLQPYIAEQANSRLGLRKAAAKLRTLQKRLLADYPDESNGQALSLSGKLTQSLALVQSLIQAGTISGNASAQQSEANAA